MKSIVDNARLVLQQVGVGVDDYLLVAVSGGIDSMVLLDVLDRLRVELGYPLQVAHLDHALRPESPADRDFVVDEVRRRDLPCVADRRDVEACARDEKLSPEEAGRHVRYAFLDEVARRVGATYIALGHHADDQAETVLMRLLRGSGTTGLGAMEVVREGRYLRPLLGVWRAEIEAYAHERDLAYREDLSNRDRRYLRNRVRWELLPLLRQYNPNISAALNRTSRLLKDEDHLLAELAQEALTAVVCERYNDKITLDSIRLVDYHIAVQRRVVRVVLQGLSATESPFDFSPIEQVLGWIGGGDERLRELGGGLRGQGSAGCYILRRGPRPKVEYSLALPGVVALAGHGVEIHSEIVPAEHFARVRGELGGAKVAFDADRLGQEVLLRSPRQGDRFQPLGMAGHKKLSDFLIDAKWPKISRDEVLVLARGEEIAWVAPLRISHAFRVDSATRRIALCQLRRAEDDYGV
ncbi:MAG: tRNA lysidine(34) synthetase TilS [Candidatus Latescibacterota bacterium]|nr:tRNA lysidine(34) synthetase TilS [Candidatus Latescibacterota bacterium]